jgi:hypothetical protein
MLPAFGSSVTLTKGGHGKQLIPNGELAKSFVGRCLLHSMYDHFTVLGGSGSFTDRMDAAFDERTSKILFGVALINAVRANNHRDDYLVGSALESHLSEVRENYIIGTAPRRVEEYAAIVQHLHDSDLYD